MVQYGIVGFGCAVTLSVSGGTSTEATISGLTNNYTYSITVAAVNNVGIGKYSEIITVDMNGKYR